MPDRFRPTTDGVANLALPLGILIIAVALSLWSVSVALIFLGVFVLGIFGFHPLWLFVRDGLLAATKDDK